MYGYAIAGWLPPFCETLVHRCNQRQGGGGGIRSGTCVSTEYAYGESSKSGEFHQLHVRRQRQESNRSESSGPTPSPCVPSFCGNTSATQPILPCALQPGGQKERREGEGLVGIGLKEGENGGGCFPRVDFLGGIAGVQGPGGRMRGQPRAPSTFR